MLNMELDGGIKIYLREIGKTDLLTPEQEVELAERINRIRQTVARMGELIETMLEAGRSEAGKTEFNPTDIDIGAVIRQVVKRQRDITPDRQFAEEYYDLPPIHFADPRLIEHILVNLLGNAVKYSPKETDVFIRVTGNGAGVKIMVTDQGVGIPEGALATLFDPFTQVVYPQVRKRAGTGLGLAITRRLCWMMGGEIDVESVSGKGSTFTVWIPSVYRNLGSGESWRPLRNKRGPGQLSGPMPISPPLPKP